MTKDTHWPHLRRLLERSKSPPLEQEEKEKNKDPCVQRYRVVKEEGRYLGHQGVQMIEIQDSWGLEMRPEKVGKGV